MEHPSLSVQLYTLREAVQEDLGGTLARLSRIGFEQVEPYGFPDLEGLGESLTSAGLVAPTGHAHYLGEDDTELHRVFASAKALNIGLAIDPYVVAERWVSEADIRETAEQLNAAAAVAAEYGVEVGYHNHAHELETQIDGRTAFEFFADLLNPEVRLEVDTYWVTVGGHDPIEILARLGDRVAAIHVKDGPATKETKDQVAVGQGSLPVRDILAAAPQALRVIELDDSRGDRFAAVADSYAWLVNEGLV
ncbi:sugar phosphate isomerase/epimerase family protein [Homoserinimonas aerilata]|nr:sugar phosphate isomerase/epimerase [Homoserinimonas aerilata]